MQKNKIKTLTATFLAAILIFINVFKTLHKHHFSYLQQKQITIVNTANVSAYFSCSICDFKIAKDSDIRIATYQVSKTGYCISSFDDCILKVPDNTSVVFDVRGPPYRQQFV